MGEEELELKKAILTARATAEQEAVELKAALEETKTLSSKLDASAEAAGRAVDVAVEAMSKRLLDAMDERRRELHAAIGAERDRQLAGLVTRADAINAELRHREAGVLEPSIMAKQIKRPAAASLACNVGEQAWNVVERICSTMIPSIGSVAGLPPRLDGYAEPAPTYTIGQRISVNRPHGCIDGLSFSMEPDVPDGLELDGATGAISGTPSGTIGSHVREVVASNAAGNPTHPSHIACLHA